EQSRPVRGRGRASAARAWAGGGLARPDGLRGNRSSCQRQFQGDKMTTPPAGVMSTSDAPAVQCHDADGVLVITINRPKVRNAVYGLTARVLGLALDQLDARDDLAVGVLTGAGGTFSAGMD